MNLKTRIYHMANLELDVWRHLAIENYLLEDLDSGECILFLWRGDAAVVLGKNQNPWCECPVDQLADADVELARRLSGGGAVYQPVQGRSGGLGVNGDRGCQQGKRRQHG